MKKISDRQYARALYEAAAKLPKPEMEEAVRNFLSLLHRRGRLGRIENIIAEFLAYAKAQDGILDMKIESARKLDKKTVEDLRNFFGKKTEAEESVNAGLLGGVKIRVGDVIYDASIKKQLTRLKQAIS